MPIRRKDGTFFGTLCAIDPKPAKLNTLEVVGMFELFAELIGTHLDAIEQLSSSEANLLDERATAELREQFIAVLGHDLRNPLASLSSGVNLIQKAKSAERAAEIGVAMQSSVKRMARLIDDLLDFARGRLGGGLALNYDKELLALVLDQVVAELRAGYPDRNIEAAFALTQEVRCDSGRVAQLLSNLLGNALKYGGPDTPVRVEATIGQGEFELSVINKGAPIPATTIERLFLPFYRGDGHVMTQGLGLGLYIVSQIANAHGGRVDVESTPEQTRFTFRMPLA